MDKNTRNALRLTTIACRKTLEADFARQLEGTFGISPDGSIVDSARLPHLTADQREQRQRIVEALEHTVSAGSTHAEALVRFIREAAFSSLNRLAALKLMEAPERGLIQPSIGAGDESNGFRQFKLISPEAIRAEPDGGYRLYLELLFADLAEEIGVLFDSEAPQATLFPAPQALAEVLARLNDPELSTIWREDETIGWIYQYFTPKEQRDEARKASAVPRNAYELAFLNQFFTPRYVVEFLTENTLGRTWYEMRQGNTRLNERCKYLVRRKHPIFLKPGEPEPTPFPLELDSDPMSWRPPYPADELQIWVRPNPDTVGWDHQIRYAHTLRSGYDTLREIPAEEAIAFAVRRYEEWQQTGKWTGTFEELRLIHFVRIRNDRFNEWFTDDDTPPPEAASLYRALCERWDYEVEAIPHRAKQDPRSLRVLDPACGSGHFLLYAFELLLIIYDEAYDDPELGAALRREWPERAAFDRAVPDLILRNNLHGIDIDLRAVQIAQLALWLRAQRAFAEQGLRTADRPSIRRVNVVAAEPLPGESLLLREFLQTIDNPVISGVVTDIWQEMQGLGEIGSLFKADDLIHQLVRQHRRTWQSGKMYVPVALFGEAKPRQQQLDLNTDFITDESFWQGAEEEVLTALRAYAESSTLAGSGDRYRRQLFADDAAQGFAFLELFVQPFDVVLMNPPFGAVSTGAKAYIERAYPRTKNDLYAAFVERGLEILRPHGYLGAITSRTGFFLTTFQKWREEIILGTTRIHVVADLGQGVLDSAMVETAAYCLEKQPV